MINIKMKEKLINRQYRKGSILNYIKNRFKETNKIKSEISTKTQFYKAGKYKTIRLGKTIIYRDHSAQNFIKGIAKDLPTSFPILKLYIKQLIAMFFTIEINNKAPSDIQGDFALLTQNENMKIFDIDNQKVFHFIKEPTEYSKIKTSYDTFKKFFNLAIIDFDDTKQLVVENLVEFSEASYKNPEFQNQIFKKVLNDFNVYLQDCSNNGKIEMLTYYERWKVSDDLKAILLKWETLYNINLKDKIWPYVYCHGDFWRDNVLVNKNEYYLIDWEWSDNYIFFYDLFTFMILQAIHQKDFTLIDTYLKGGFDQEFTNIFSIMNMVYHTEKKLAYLLYCIAEHLASRGKQDKYLVLLVDLEARYNP